MKLIETLKFDCSECNGAGYIYWTHGEDYDVESCDCQTGKEN